MEGLFTRLNPESELVAAHAAHYAEEENGTLIRMAIRPGILWSDGVELVAQHYYDSWIRTLDPNTGSARAQHLFPIAGAEEWHVYKKGGPETIGIKVIGRYGLEIKLKKPNVFFKAQLANPHMFPIRTDLIQKYGANWATPENLVTLGPFRITEYKQHSHLYLEPNPRYSGSPKPQISRVTMKIVPETNSAVTLFDVGKLDVLSTISPLDMPQQHSKSTFITIAQINTYYIGFSNRGVTANPLVRKAIAHALDEREIVRSAHALHHPQKSFLPLAIKESNSHIGLAYDPARARTLLAQAGYPNGKQFPVLKYAFNPLELHRQVAESVQVQLKRNLNVEVALESYDWSSYLATLKKSPPDLYRMAWSEDNIAHEFMLMWLSGSEFNFSRWSHPRYDKLIHDALAESNFHKRKAMYDEAQRILLEKDAVIVPLFTSVLSCLVKPSIKDLVISPSGEIGLSGVWIDKKQL
jgi:oligopeptide transport system substrate-binding protein